MTSKENNHKYKCSQCLKLFPENETDNCEKCGKKFCTECLTYYGANSELAFCPKCEAK
jgi:hypothetical protein